MLFVLPVFVSYPGVALEFLLIAIAAIAHLAVLISVPVYYLEAKELKAANNDWVPLWWAYTIASIVIGVAPFVYLIQRLRHTDVDVADIL